MNCRFLYALRERQGWTKTVEAKVRREEDANAFQELENQVACKYKVKDLQNKQLKINL
jgi:hypothetical protein